MDVRIRHVGRSQGHAEPVGETPIVEVSTYCVNAERARAELDYTDMVALSGMFRRWAIYESDESVPPDYRTRLIEYSADYERLANAVGEKWIASHPTDPIPLMKFLAGCERRTNNVIDLSAIKRQIGDLDEGD